MAAWNRSPTDKGPVLVPILSPTPLFAEITYLGLVADRKITLCSDPVETVTAALDGFEGEYHGGLVRSSCSRVTAQYPKGTTIRNTRQISILSEEELQAIAADMDVPSLEPSWLGANVVLKGIPGLTLLPPSARLQSDTGTTMTIDIENGPCKFPADVIEQHHPGHGKRFISAASHRRGLLGWIEREGKLTVGDRLRLHVPPLRPYPHLPQD